MGKLEGALLDGVVYRQKNVSIEEQLLQAVRIPASKLELCQAIVFHAFGSNIITTDTGTYKELS